MSRRIDLPDLCLVLLAGASGSGKSTFARRHFKPTEVLSSDYFRGLMADDENDQSVTPQAFEALHYIAAKRLANGRLTVIDATNVRAEDRKPLVELARKHHCLAIAIVLDIPESVCQARNAARPDRDFGAHVVRNQIRSLRRHLRSIAREGFHHAYTLASPEEIETANVARTPLWNDRRNEHGPFDVIGDVHGCASELEQLLTCLGYRCEALDTDDPVWGSAVWRHPGGRKAIFVGDLVDRGPRVLDTVRIVRNMAESGSALCVPGNHDVKLARAIQGRRVKIAHGLDRSLAELEAVPVEWRDTTKRAVGEFLDSLVSHYVLDDGKLVVAHAGLREEMHGGATGGVREFALYGETTGESDEFGLPVRCNWAADYRGRATVVYGHTPVPDAEWLNRTVNIDTGCVFGGKLTALRYPEREFVAVPSAREYTPPSRPFLHAAPALTAQQEFDDVLDMEDVIGKRLIELRDGQRFTIREENAIAALEVMSRFAADPRWIIYLPPTMSPCATSKRPDLIEHPAEAFAYFASEEILELVCEEKHMGSRAVVVVCRDADTARQRFGDRTGRAGMCYTRTGRPFFQDEGVEASLLDVVRRAMTECGLWTELSTDWVCLDCELMPWSAKAQELLRRQYAAVGASSNHALRTAVSFLERAAARGVDVAPMLDHARARAAMAAAYRDSYRRYCWTVQSAEDLKLAPFHLLASEGRVHSDRDHAWHMAIAHRLCDAAANSVLHKTRYLRVALSNADQMEGAVQWWTDLTEAGGEGMVVKPLEFAPGGPRGPVQPAVKCRGREYLRIIYGPEYTAPDQIERLRGRGLGRKRSLAMREFALGMEALHRFVAREPLRRVHECVFGVLALESEPVDPRL